MHHQKTYCTVWPAAGLAMGLLWPSVSLRADTANQLFVERAYHDLLTQVPDEGNLTILAGDLDAEELTLMQVAGRIDGGDAFHALEVQQQYRALLHRAPDPMSLNGWVQALGAGTTVEQLQSSVAGSLEYYQNRGGGTDAGFLTALYPDLLGRPITLTEEHLDGAALAGGESRTNLAAGILGSIEYDRHLVAELYRRYLRRPVDPTGSQTYVNLLQAGTRDEQVIADIVGSGEYYNLPLLAGDANFDQSVGFDDLIILARNYGKTGAHWFDGDFNGDGWVGFDDLISLARDYGQNAGVASAFQPAIAPLPEPSCLLACVGTAGVILCRRRSGESGRAQ